MARYELEVRVGGPVWHDSSSSTTYRVSWSYFGVISCHETPIFLHGGTIWARSTSSGGYLLHGGYDMEEVRASGDELLHGDTMRSQSTNSANGLPAPWRDMGLAYELCGQALCAASRYGLGAQVGSASSPHCGTVRNWCTSPADETASLWRDMRFMYELGEHGADGLAFLRNADRHSRTWQIRPWVKGALTV